MPKESIYSIKLVLVIDKLVYKYRGDNGGNTSTNFTQKGKKSRLTQYDGWHASDRLSLCHGARNGDGCHEAYDPSVILLNLADDR